MPTLTLIWSYSLLLLPWLILLRICYQVFLLMFDVNYLAVRVWADTAHCRQLCSIPCTTESAGIWAAGGWFTCKNNKTSQDRKSCTKGSHEAKQSCRKNYSGRLCCHFTRVLSELHHSLHCLRVCQSHEPEELSPPTALMEIHLYGFLFLLEHLKAAMKLG